MKTDKKRSRDAFKEVNKFYVWMIKIKSIHLADNLEMSKAFNSVFENNK
jgi:hypothetical protein